MVSSKCRAGESPSPFQLTAALMPPCAQTECERLTGTIEKRSTATPASAALIVVMRPASPPPTTMTRGCVALIDILRSRSSICFARAHRYASLALIDMLRSRSCPERHQDGAGRAVHHDEEDQRRDPDGALRARTDRDPPGDGERPEAVREVKDGGEHTRKEE